MEHRFHHRLQISLDHRLGNSVRDRRYAQRPRLSIALRYVYPSNRRRQVTSRRHPIPDSIEVVPQILLELSNRLVINTCRTSICLHPLVCLPHLALGNTKRFCLIHADPPLAGCPPNKAGRRRPFGPVPLQDLQPYYERLRPCAPHRYSGPCGTFRLGFSLHIGTTGSYVPYQSLDQGHAAFMPDASWAVSRLPSTLFRDRSPVPVSTSLDTFRHVISGSLAFVSLNRHLTESPPPFPATLTTTALNRRSLWRFEACSCKPTSRGLPSSLTKHRFHPVVQWLRS